MSSISGTSALSSKTIDDNHKEQTIEPQRKQAAIDPNTMRAPLSSSDIATVARNLAQRGVETIGRAKMSSSASTSHSYLSEADAKVAFSFAASRLTNIVHWNALSGRENATFALYDRSGAAITGRPAAVGDFIQIRLPGQLKLDWVRIEDVAVTTDRAAIRVRPTFDPTNHPQTPNVTAHFFTREATNTFILERSGMTVTARVEGRDESANVGASSGGTANAIRNRGAAEGGWTGAQRHQWNRFTENLVK